MLDIICRLVFLWLKYRLYKDLLYFFFFVFFFSSRRRHTRYIGDWSSDVCSSDLMQAELQERRKWVSKERFLEGLAVANMVPGATATQLGIFLAYARGGWWGGLRSEERRVGKECRSGWWREG